jgi:poly-gamma-glutamate synthase PgsB/CapB
LFTADEKAYDFYKELGYENKTEVFLAADESKDFEGIDFIENVSLACMVCEHLGVKKQVALTGMSKYKKDPGSLKIYQIENKNRCQIEFINALAANDPDSTEKIFHSLSIDSNKHFNHKVMLINNRFDRATRMNQYIDFTVNMEGYFNEVWIIGDLKNIMKKRLIKRGIKSDRIKLLENINHVDTLKKDTLIFAVGNIGGYGHNIVKHFEREGEANAG